MHETKGFSASTVSLFSQQCHHTYLTVQAGCNIAAPAEDSGSSGIFINMMHRMPQLDRDPAHAARPEAPGRSAMLCDRANSGVLFSPTALKMSLKSIIRSSLSVPRAMTNGSPSG